MSVQAISWVLNHSRSTGATRCVLIAIANHVDAEGRGWAYVAGVMREANCSLDTYRRAVKWAEEAGELERMVNEGQARKAAPNRKPNEFCLRHLGTADCTPQQLAPPSNLPTPETADCPPQTPVCPPQIAPPEPLVLLEPSLEPSVRVPSFADFWTVYPRKASKAAAAKAWAKAVKRTDPNHILDAAGRLAADPNREDAYTPHASTWLNQARWDDPPLPPRNGNRTDRSLGNIANVLLNKQPAIGARR